MESITRHVLVFSRSGCKDERKKRKRKKKKKKLGRRKERIEEEMKQTKENKIIDVVSYLCIWIDSKFIVWDSACIVSIIHWVLLYSK